MNTLRPLMEYTPPQEVTSPRDCIDNVQVIHDGGLGEGDEAKAYSVATIEWEGVSCLAIRWNVAQREWEDPEKVSGERVCVGMPSSRGYPVWFILPKEILDADSDVRRKIDAVWPRCKSASE